MFDFSSSGCLNGGGQIKPKNGQSAKDLIQLLETLYMQDVSSPVQDTVPHLQKIYLHSRNLVEVFSFIYDMVPHPLTGRSCRPI